MQQKQMEEIYCAYAADVYQFLLYLCKDEYLAEDILQDTFLKAIENINQFDGRCKLTSWLCQIAKNQYFDHLRKTKKISTAEWAEEDAPDPQNPCLELMIQQEIKSELMEIIHSLPDPYKEVVLLRVYAEMSFKEIANLFGRNEVWGRVTFMRGKNMLLEKYHPNR